MWEHYKDLMTRLSSLVMNAVDTLRNQPRNCEAKLYRVFLTDVLCFENRGLLVLCAE